MEVGSVYGALADHLPVIASQGVGNTRQGMLPSENSADQGLNASSHRHSVPFVWGEERIYGSLHREVSQQSPHEGEVI
jgi:hypothetical protein